MRSFLCYIVVAMWVLGCTQKPEVQQHRDTEFIALEMTYAKGLKIFKKGNEYRVEVRNPQDTTKQLGSYFFTRQSYSESGIFVPVQSVALNSTTFIAYFDKLGESSVITGVTFADKAMNKNLQKQVEENKIAEITSAGELDFEKVLALHPDVLMAYAYPGSDFQKLTSQGIPVVLNMEYLENHPLGRAEWVKLAGILTGKVDEAFQLFKNIETTYRELKERAAIGKMPTVFTGSRFEEIWYAPGGDSYIAHYINDAGAKYTFENLKGAGSHEIDYEAALAAISAADYWGMVTAHQGDFTMQSVLNMDSFYGTFKSFRDQHIFVCNTLQSDYFGDAVMEPEVILADMVSIFKPDVLPEHKNRYFFNIAGEQSLEKR